MAVAPRIIVSRALGAARASAIAHSICSPHPGAAGADALIKRFGDPSFIRNSGTFFRTMTFELAQLPHSIRKPRKPELLCGGPHAACRSLTGDLTADSC